MPKRTRDYRSWQLKSLSNPESAAAYLNAALKDSPKLFLRALRNVAEAKGMTAVADESEGAITREALYRTLSEEGNPRMNTLISVLKVAGLRIAVISDSSEEKANRQELAGIDLLQPEQTRQLWGFANLRLSTGPMPMGIEGILGHSGEALEHRQAKPIGMMEYAQP